MGTLRRQPYAPAEDEVLGTVQLYSSLPVFMILVKICSVKKPATCSCGFWE